MTLDSSEYDKGLDDSKGKADSFGQKLISGLGTAGKVTGAVIGAVATGATALTGALVKGAGDVASYGDNIDKMSQKMGLSAEAYQEWDAIMQHSGTSIESLQAGMKTLANAVENGNDAFERLGITQEDIASMDNEELFSATISALQNVDNETERTYLAGQLLGRGATELGALLNTSAEDTEAMRQRVHELGGVMSDEAVKAAAGYQDSLQDMQTAFSGLSRSMLSEFLPGITSVMDGLTEIFSGNSGRGLSIITSGIASLVDNISKEVPRFIELGANIVNALITAITQNLPTLLEAGASAVLTIADGLIQNLPQIIAAALQVVVTLANGIADNLPELIPTIVDVVLQIVDTLTDPDTLETLINAALKIMIALAEGLIKALPELIRKAPEIIKNLVTALVAEIPQIIAAALQLIISLGSGLIEAIPELLVSIPQIIAAIVGGLIDGVKDLWEVGEQLVQGLFDGISSAWGWLKDSVKGLFGGLVDGIKGLLGIASPSKVFSGIGENMAAGLGKGWDSEFSDIQRDINGDLDFGARTVDINRNVTSSYANGGFGAAALNQQPIRIEFTGDLAQLARVLQPKIVDETNRRGTSYVTA